MLPEQFGRYRLEEVIGGGGMGEIFRAVDTSKDRVVALKRLRPHLAGDQEFQERFRRESRCAAQLREPHVIPIHDFGEIDGRLFIDMRLVDGEDLAALLARRGPLAPEQAVRIVCQVAAALDAAHADGLVHRDIKPSNVLVSENEQDGVHVYVVDFGIARTATATTITGLGSVIGTPEYMAPERYHLAAVDRRVDVYSLACVLFESLTAQKPYPSPHAAAQMRAHLDERPPRPSEYRADLPYELDGVIAQGMAKDPARRYASAGSLSAAALLAIRTGTQRQRRNRLAPETIVGPDGVRRPRRTRLRSDPWSDTALLATEHGERAAEGDERAELPRSGFERLPVALVITIVAACAVLMFVLAQR